MADVKKPIRKSGFKVENIGNELVLYNSDQKAVHVLNTTAQAIWELCDGSHTLEEIGQEIKKRFAVPEGYDLIGDIRQTLATFTEKGILEQGG